jgi:hypothetical protein
MSGGCCTRWEDRLATLCTLRSAISLVPPFFHTRPLGRLPHHLCSAPVPHSSFLAPSSCSPCGIPYLRRLVRASHIYCAPQHPVMRSALLDPARHRQLTIHTSRPKHGCPPARHPTGRTLYRHASHNASRTTRQVVSGIVIWSKRKV